MRKAIVVCFLIATVVGSWLGRADAATSAAAQADVHIVNGAPNPQTLTINDGDTVTFVNDDDVPHSIWAAGQQRGRTIQPHTRSDTFGPFQTAGQGGRSNYQVDENGASGVIVISETPTTAAPPPPSTTAPTTTTTAATTTTALPTTTTTTSTTTTTRPTTTSTTTSTTVASSGAAPGSTSDDDSSSRAWLGWAGLVVALVGIGNVVRVVLRPKKQTPPVPVVRPEPVEPTEPIDLTEAVEPTEPDELTEPDEPDDQA